MEILKQVNRKCALCVLALALSCLPERSKYVGGACDARRQCPEGLDCIGGYCESPLGSQGGGTPSNVGGGTGAGGNAGQSDGGTTMPTASKRQNLLPIGDFEQADSFATLRWLSPGPVIESTDVKRSGSAAARIEGAQKFLRNGVASKIGGGLSGTFCTELFALGSKNATLTMSSRSTGVPTGPEPPPAQENLIGQAVLSPTNWTKLLARLTVSKTLIELNFELANDGTDPQAPLWVDDISVWRSEDGSCSETP